MPRFIATAVLLAAFYGPSPLAAQDQLDQQDLQRTIEDAIDASEPDAPLAPQPEVLDFEATAPELLAEDELDELLAPVALYPDSLLAQVLVASTFPLQIVQADRILEDSADMTDAEVTDAIDARDWDPSVLVLLTAFPDVIRRMAEDLDDTERLGIAMGDQDGDVLASVQRLREQAEATGWLEDNEAQIVERVDDRIVIEPADPDVVYVPRYDPQMAFISPPTAPTVIQRPGTNPLANPLVAGAIGFGSALLVTELFGDDDNDKNGWDDYWRKDRRTIDWSERQFYPRAENWDDDGRRRESAWSRERDRFWDREGRRWRAETAAERREARRDRHVRAWQVRRDPETGRAQVRLQDWTNVRAIERRENQADRRDEAERRREAEADARRRDAARSEAAEARRDRERARERRAQQADADDRSEAQERREANERREAQERRDQQPSSGAAAESAREAEADRDRRAARREANEREEVARAWADREQRDQARPAEEPRDGNAARREETDREPARQAAEARAKAAADRDRQAERAQAEQAEARRKQNAAARQHEASEPAKAAQPAASKREPEAQAKRPKAQAEARERAGSGERQADQPARRAAEAKEQPAAKNKKRSCPAGDKECRQRK